MSNKHKEQTAKQEPVVTSLKANRISKRIENGFKLLGIIVSITALCFSAWQYNAGRKREDASNRPFITIRDFQFINDTLVNHSSPVFRIFNAGTHLANEMTVSNIVIDSITGEKIDSQELTYANPLASDININYSASYPLPPNKKYLFKTVFKYRDALTDDLYSDSLYFSWKTNANLKLEPNNDMRGITIPEARRCDSLINAN
jgi:hypothetical protein